MGNWNSCQRVVDLCGEDFHANFNLPGVPFKIAKGEFSILPTRRFFLKKTWTFSWFFSIFLSKIHQHFLDFFQRFRFTSSIGELVLTVSISDMQVRISITRSLLNHKQEFQFTESQVGISIYWITIENFNLPESQVRISIYRVSSRNFNLPESKNFNLLCLK